MLNEQLIIKALALTDKTMEDMMENTGDNLYWEDFVFSIEKFAYYLLSHEFLEKYGEWMSYVFVIGIAINECQEWNQKPLEELLSKIK